MKTAEEKNKTLQIKLLEDIGQADHMVQYYIGSKANEVTEKLLLSKTVKKDGGLEVMEVSKETFNVVWQFLSDIKEKNYSRISTQAVKYAEDKQEKEKLLNILTNG